MYTVLPSDSSHFYTWSFSRYNTSAVIVFLMSLSCLELKDTVTVRDPFFSGVNASLWVTFFSLGKTSLQGGGRTKKKKIEKNCSHAISASFLHGGAGVYLNLMTLWIAGPSTLNVQSVRATDSGLVKENVASHGWFSCGCELSCKKDEKPHSYKTRVLYIYWVQTGAVARWNIFTYATDISRGETNREIVYGQHRWWKKINNYLNKIKIAVFRSNRFSKWQLLRVRVNSECNIFEF